jgi:hypothetical protein
MPPVRSLVFKHLAHCSKLIVVILLFNEIISTYSRCAEKGLVYIIIIALSSRYPFSCLECMKLNIYSFYNIYSISNAKYICLTVHLYTL